MTHDGMRGVDLEYNSLNLVEKVRQGNTAMATYRWLADGTKAGVTDNDGNGFEYLGSFVYVRDASGLNLESASFGSGRFVASNTGEVTPIYHFTDHLGSVRVVYDSPNAVLAHNDYYAFGLKHENPNLANHTANRYLFNGKEEQVTGGLGLLDYGARTYDPNIARFTEIDPLAEEYAGISPYVYTLNNPIRYIDPDGRDVWEIDYDGRVKWIEESKQHTMYALNKDRERTGQSITIGNRSIFDQLAKKSRYERSRSAFGYSSEIGDVFVFVSDNTGVEWSLEGYEIDNQNQYILHTDHSENSVRPWKQRGYEIQFLLFDIHSHPGTDGGKGASIGDMTHIGTRNYNAERAGVKLPPHYVYHQKSKNLYHYTPYNNSIFIKRITNNQGLRFLFPK